MRVACNNTFMTKWLQKPRPMCSKCGKNKVQMRRNHILVNGRWVHPPLLVQPDKCSVCQRTDSGGTDPGFPTYRSMAEVKIGWATGTLIRILNNPEPYYDGVYRIRYFGGCCAGKRVWPGPFANNGMPAKLLRWPDNVPPEYTVPGYDDNEAV